MGEKPVTYETTVQARDTAGRKTIELPAEIRDNFEAGDHVEVTIKKLKGKEEEIIYKTTIQKRDTKGRKTIELRAEDRDNYKPGDPVQVKIRKLE